MRLHLIANSHIDPAWLWDKNEGIDEVLDTFHAACNRLDENQDVFFTASSLQFYDWVRKLDRRLFRRIRRHVKSGRWEVAGGWWVEADTNLPNESSLRMQAELGQEFALRHFGVRVEVAYLPDSFGHPATLPKILGRSGFRYFLFFRPDRREKPDLPGDAFHWRYDGHDVLAYRAKAYGNPVNWTEAGFRARLEDPDLEAGRPHAVLYGMANHGGAMTAGEIEFLSRYIREQPPGDAGFSTAVSFFRDLERVRGIPMYEGDLHYHAVGCYSVMRNIKKAYRSAEHAFACAERASEMAIGTGGLPPAMSEQIAFNAFHDILPGSCVRHAAKQAIEELGCVSHQCREHVYRSLKRLSLESPARFPEGEFRIFNTLPFPVTAPLALESMTYFRPLREFRENNRSIPIQEVLPLSRAFTHRWEFVDTLPPQGFRSYHFEQDEPVAASIRDIPHFAPGSFAALPFLARPIRFLLLADKSDLWGHGVKSFNEVDDEFQLVAEGVMDGPVVRKTHQRWTCRRSVLDITYSSYRELPGIYAHIEVSWAEERAILKMEMEPAEAGEVLVMQAPGGPVERPADGLELPLHRWVALGGLSVIQDGAFACDAAAGRLRLTLVRSSIYSLHDPVVPNPLDPELLTDQGAHSFRLLFLPQASEPAQLDSIAAAFLEPCIVIREACRELS